MQADLSHDGVMAILRTVPEAVFEALVSRLLKWGVRYIEVPMNAPQAAERIALVARLVAEHNTVVAEGSGVNQAVAGAGTVTTAAEFEQARAAGADFFVAPHFDIDILSACRSAGRAYIPGVFTPTELFHAWQNGCHTLKLFPAAVFGPSYLTTLREPYSMPSLRLLVSGGVSPGNAAEYRLRGASIAALGRSTFSDSRLQPDLLDDLHEDINKIVTVFGS